VIQASAALLLGLHVRWKPKCIGRGTTMARQAIRESHLSAYQLEAENVDVNLKAPIANRCTT
jgi:hypothetical protein